MAKPFDWRVQLAAMRLFSIEANSENTDTQGIQARVQDRGCRVICPKLQCRGDSEHRRNLETKTPVLALAFATEAQYFQAEGCSSREVLVLS